MFKISTKDGVIVPLPIKKCKSVQIIILIVKKSSRKLYLYSSSLFYFYFALKCVDYKSTWRLFIRSNITSMFDITYLYSKHISLENLNKFSVWEKIYPKCVFIFLVHYFEQTKLFKCSEKVQYNIHLLRELHFNIKI